MCKCAQGHQKNPIKLGVHQFKSAADKSLTMHDYHKQPQVKNPKLSL